MGDSKLCGGKGSGSQLSGEVAVTVSGGGGVGDWQWGEGRIAEIESLIEKSLLPALWICISFVLIISLLEMGNCNDGPVLPTLAQALTVSLPMPLPVLFDNYYISCGFLEGL
jgi:hypothetical protein